MAKFEANLGLNTKEFDSKLKRAEGAFSGFGSALLKIGGILGTVFATTKIIEFSKESMRLAGKAEGIVNAFKRLGSVGTKALGDLSKATRGALDESDLMQIALKASNFGIEFQNLGKYLQFATQRAMELGIPIKQAADLMIDAIGRKSSRSLIQLGISTKTASAAFSTADGLIKLVNGDLARMGTVADTASVRQERLAASVQNLKEAWGQFLNDTPFIYKAIDTISEKLKIVAERGLFGSIFETGAKAASRKAEKEKWDVTAEGIPVSLLNGPAAEVVGIRKIAEPLKDATKAAEDAKKAFDDLKNGYADFLRTADNGETTIDQIATSLANLHNKISRINEEEAKSLKVGIGNLSTTVSGDNTPNSIIKDSTNQDKNLDGLRKVTKEYKLQDEAVNALSQSLYEMFQGTEDWGKNMVQSLIDSITQFIAKAVSAMMIQGIINLVSNIAGGNGFSFSGAASGKSVLSSIGMASGGLAYGPSLAMVGEYSGASGNPEVIAPLNKLMQYMGGSQNVNVRVEGRIRGRDLDLVQRRYGVG